LLLPPVYLAQERLRLVEKIGVRREETLTVEHFEFPEQIDAATEDREHFGSIAMRATELHADSRVRVADHTPTFIHAFPSTRMSVCLVRVNERGKKHEDGSLVRGKIA
jgi:hypothetical protein